MFKIFSNAWKVGEIRKKILYTLMILVIVRIGAQIALPGINVAYVQLMSGSQGIGTLYNVIAGGANSAWSIFALGIGPYITSSIIMQLLTVAIPKLEQLNKEGEEGRKKIQSYTRYLTVVLALLQATGYTLNYRSLFLSDSILVYAIAVLSMVAGTIFIMWLAEQITAKGISNGSSMIIFVNIISSLPMAVASLYNSIVTRGVIGVVSVVAVLVVLLLVIFYITIINEGERRIPVQYSSKMVGRRAMGGQSTTLPIRVNTAGVISIIFAISILQFPAQIANFMGGATGVFADIIAAIDITAPIGTVLYVVLIILFSFFYTSITVNPNEIAENMKKNGGFIPGIRPGAPTSNYIAGVVKNVTAVGAILFAIVALVPVLLQWILGVNVGFGGTTLIIVVGVCLDIVKSLESQLLQRHYKGFLNE